MKKGFTKLMAAFALLVLVALSGKAWATDVTFSYSDYVGQGGPSGTGSEYTMVKTDVSIGDTKFYGNSSYAHFYAGGVTTITPSSDVTITQIVLTASGTSYNGFQSGGTVTPSTGSVSANGVTVTWTGSAAEAFTISHNKQIRWTSIVVTYSISGSVPTPTITFSGQGANLGIKGVGEEFTTSFTVSQQDLEDDITLTLQGPGSLSTDLIEQGDDPTEVTWNYTPTTVGDINATITATSEGAEPVTFTITGEAKAYHSVNIASGIENGSVTADPTQAYEGQYVTLTVTPAEGYELDELTVVDANNNPVTVDANNVFQMPDSDVTVNATFVEAAPTTIVTDELTNSNTIGETTTTYKSWTATGTSGTVYSGQSAGSNGTIQLRSSGSNSGIVSTTSVGKVKKVTVVWNSATADGRTLNVYGSNTAYTAPTDLYGSSTQGTLLGTIVKGTGNSTELTISDNYTYVGLRSASSAMYLDEIDIDWAVSGTPTCATPTFNPAAGTYTETQSVTISCATEGATIYYTLDESTPSATNGTQYTAAIEVSVNTTIKAIAVKEGYNESQVATATYTIIPPVVATPTFSPAAGVYTEAQSVTISCETDGATIQYKLTENGEWQVYIEALNIDETTTIWAKATKEGMTDSEIATAVYTIEEALNTMQAIFDRATEVGNTATNVNIALQNWVVSGVSTNGKNVFVTDGTKGFVIFDNGANMGFAVGDILSGTVSCKVQLYHGFAELTQLNSTTEGLSVDTGGTVTVAEIAMAELAGVNTSALVHYDNLTCSVNGNNYYLTDGTTTLQVYNALYAFGSTFVAEHVYNITGVYQQYNTNNGDTKEILPRSADDIEEVVVAEPSITLNYANPNQHPFAPNSPYEFVFTYESGGGYIDEVTCENFTASSFSIQYCNANGEPVDVVPDWVLDNNVVPDNEHLYLYFNVNVNSDATARTCYFKVGAANGTVMVYSDLVTVNQAGFVATIAVNPTVVNATAAETDGTITVTYTNIDFTNAPEIVFYSDAEGTIEVEASYYADWFQAEINNDNNVDYLIGTNDGEARTAYFKVYGLDNYVQDVYSDLVTVNQAKYVLDYATLPFEWEGGLPDAFDALDGTTLNSVGSYPNQETYQMKLDGDGDYIQVKCDQQPGVVAFGVKMVGGNKATSIVVQGSSDGETFTDVQTFEISGNQNSTHDFETTNDFASNDRYVRLYFSKGTGSNVGVGPISIAKVDNTPRITLSYYNTNEHPFTPEDPYMIVFPNVAAGGYIDQIEYVNFPNALNVNDFTIQFYDAEDQVISQPDWIELAQVSLVDENFILQVQTYGNDSEARTAYFKVGAYLTVTEVVYSDLVTVTQEAYVAPFEPTIYTRVTTIVPGEHYIIVSFNGDESFAMGDQVNNYRQSVAISADGTNATVVNEDVFDFVIQSEGNNYTIYDSRNTGYLCAVSSNSNSIGFQTTNDDNGIWSISMEADGEATVAAQGEYTRNHLRYNTNNPRFSCYAETSSVDTKVYFYVKSDMAPATYTLNINGYANDDVKDGYYLIASPVYVNPATVEGMTTDDFDLYYYDDAEELEWRNYEETPFSLVPGKGYLYAKKATVENPTYSFDLTGVPYDGQGEFNLTAGWNLVGNPFGQTAYIEGEFYAMNEEGSEIMTNASTGAVAVMQGVFVLAGEEGEIITFTPQAPQKKAGLALNLISNRSNVIDRAIVRFGEGRQLPKFQLNPNNTKLFISQGNNDFAVVRSAAYGEMPVCFKAQSNGTYTISVNAENVEVNYLHLIDNMTGNDIDLLQVPTYTFEATTNDYASRFRLVFNVTGVEENMTSTEPFAFFNGSEWVISNMGTATLQMVDLTGRILSSESISGNATFSTANLNAGVYVMRLVNGENTKIQKIIIK